MIDKALLQIQKWQEQGLNMIVSVNIGARQLLEENFVERLRDILSKYPDIKPSMLEIEVLETSKLEDVAIASVVINKCKELGILFSLDDFGTGYSSLTYLKQLPVNHIKIDQSFVRDMLTNSDDLAILDGVIKLSDAFRRHVIAEGVETFEQGKVLLQLGCELAQGYAIARPMPADALPLWLKEWAPDNSWINQILMSSNQLQLLFAGIEHQAWIANVASYIKGKSPSLKPQNKDECYFGDWLNKEGKGYLKSVNGYYDVKILHNNIHNVTSQLLELHQQKNHDEALKLLETLYVLCDELLKILNRYVFIPIN